MTLPELIAAIEAGPATRELNDAVLRSLGFKPYGYKTSRGWKWQAPDRGPIYMNPSPLSDLEDAKLAVPEGVVYRIFVQEGFSSVEMVTQQQFNECTFQGARVTGGIDVDPATALTLAALKAEQAKQEAEG